ncbi:uncharacterized protein HMPREF1541_10514 [Cyphellophora europaea CBS 101466]|uniref:Nonribosomal peptide synthetase sidC n=1 Tax=Cyphellophora europaea (strain CBS 101466) TaxID=1220924 RepID=W2S8T6_CYPE1|nr:uncharacterized protein HMPREF1541_10514 [Cyphellophora europaea CBS 101466]ETN44334.1 hypothetical protein HMPREF1541_10514 [Cyphellophora europaea CBS 101466]
MSVVNRYRRTLPGPDLLHELIAEPDDDTIAVEFILADQSLYTLTYGAFRSLSDGLADQIRDAISAPGRSHIIPAIIPQCPELYIAWRAVLQAGACFCPVSPDVPPERLNFILNDVSADLVLCIQETSDLIQSSVRGLSCLSVVLEDLESTESHGRRLRRTSTIDSRSPAYIMYTSGSTGLPKGVQISHSAATQSLLAHDEHIPTFKRFLQFASPTFDVSVFEIFFPLFRGATLVSRLREHMLADLPGTITMLKADAAELTPTVAGTLLRTRDAAPCLKILLTTGEMLTRSVVAEFGGNQDKHSMLYAMYGPTEATIHCTVAPKVSSSSTVRNIGRPLSTVTAFILKDTGSQNAEIAPVGQAGELAIAGQLADGYLNRQDQTEAAFVRLSGHGRVYRTGDRAICASDGTLEVLGRMNAGQVKLRGQRVELGEIEEIALKTPGVVQAVATDIEDTLILFCAAGTETETQHIQATCKSWLPPFMRPSEIILMGQDLPKLPSGKVDRKALEADFRGREQTVTAMQDLTTSTERMIASALAQELPRPVDRDEDLWACGMDSLRAIRIASALRLKVPSLSIGMILTSSTIVELATKIDSSNGSSQNGHSTSLYEDSDAWEATEHSVREYLPTETRAQLDEVLPCTPIQVAMLAETVADKTLNFNTILLQRRGVSEAAVWSALCTLARSTRLLRSGFVATHDEAMPFVRVVWKKLDRNELSMLNPLQLAPNPHDPNQTVVRIHHALYDGWSWDLILDDLNSILEKAKPPERTPFDKVSRALRNHSDMATHNPAMRYWTSLLKDTEHQAFPSLVSTRPKNSSRYSHRHRLNLSFANLSAQATSLRIGRQAFLQACWAVVLSAYTDSEEVLFGTVVSGRHAVIEGIEEVIGPCLATVPTRLRLGRVKTIRDLLNYIQRQNLDSLEYYDTPLHDIRKAAGVNSRRKLFDSIVVWQESSVRGGYRRRYVETADGYDALDYTAVVEMEPTDEELLLKITANDLLIPKQQAQAMADQIDILLNAIAGEPQRALTDVWASLPKRLLSVANPRFEAYSGRLDIAHDLGQFATEAPNRIAIKFVNEYDPVTREQSCTQVSYRELHQRANNAQYRLTAHNVGPDDLVCIYAPKSIDLYVAILSVVMSGAGYMCIDPRTPSDRVRHILRQAKCALVVADSQERLVAVESNSVLLEHLLEPIGRTDIRLPLEARGSHLAYAVFTSGTTGTPKGVLMTRRNLGSHLAHLSSIYPHNGSGDSLLQACSPAFDVSVFEIFWTLHVGMTLIAAHNDILFRDIEQFIHHFDVTHLSMTPSVAALVQPSKVPKVKMLVTAGEPMNSRVFQQWTGRGLYQGYGPSETTNICNVRPEVQSYHASNNVGPVFPNTSAFVCRRLHSDQMLRNSPLNLNDFQLVPQGVSGEIWIGGDQVGRGYVDPLLTQQAFLDHPEYGWLYRSGDIGRVLSDGSFTILGREDDQAKLRGQRIELGEVSSHLLSAGYVQDAVGFIDTVQDVARLLAFVVLDDASRKREAVLGLFHRLEDRLPSYMIPTAIVPVSNIPLTRQGKVDKAQLRRVFMNLPREELECSWRQALHDTQKQPLKGSSLAIARALSETLGIAASVVEGGTSFYELGLDSLSAIRFTQQLRRQGLPQVDVSTILQNPSISSLLRTIESKNESIGIQRRNGLHKASFNLNLHSDFDHPFRKAGLQVEKVLACTDLQLSMLSATEDGHVGAYRNKLPFRVKGNVKRLEAAWEKVLNRQQLLRTVFVRSNDPEMPYVQVVLGGVQLPWTVKGRSPGSAARDTNPLRKWYDLKLAAQGNTCYLTFEIHHALYDAVAMDTLLREVLAAYSESTLGTPVPFDNYLEYAESLNQRGVGDFWMARLRNVKTCRLKSIIEDSAQLMDGSVRKAKQQSVVKLADLEGFVKQHSVTMLSCLQAATSKVLMRCFESPQVCFGNVYSGRNLPIEGMDQIVGPCFNTLPVPVRVEWNTSTARMLHDLQKFNVDVLPFQPSSLRRLQKQYSADGQSLFDFLLLLQAQDQEIDNDIWQLEEEQGDMVFPFILEVSMKAEKHDYLQLVLHSTVAVEEVLHLILQDFDNELLDTIRYPERAAYSPSSSSLAGFLKPASVPSNGVVNGSSEDTEQIYNVPSLEMESVNHLLKEMSPLKNRQILPSTTIFQLGLDSINAVQLAAGLRNQGYQITSTEILQGPTLVEIATKCSRSRSKADEDNRYDLFDTKAFDAAHRQAICSRLSLREDSVAAILPCTPLQGAMLSQYLQSAGALYYNTLTLKLHRSLSKEKLRSAWQIAMECHEMLRAGFVDGSGKQAFLMVVYRAATAALPWHEIKDMSGPSETRGELAASMFRPPWRLDYDEDDHQLKFTILHALYDAQSLDMILADVANIVLNQTVAHTVPVPPTLSTILSMGEQESSKAIWTREENMMQPTKFPDLNIYNVVDSHFDVSERCMAMRLTAATQCCAHLGVTLQAACQVAWAQLLSAYTAQERVTFGIILSGRTFGDSRDAAAFPCINTLPFTTSLRGSTKELLISASSINSSLLEHQHTPLTSIRRWQGLEEEPFNTILVLQKYDSRVTEDAPWEVIDETARAEYGVSLEILPDTKQDSLKLRMTFSESLLPNLASHIVLRQFEEQLSSVLHQEEHSTVNRNPELLSILSPVEDHLVAEVDLLHELVESSASRQPDSQALELITGFDNTQPVRQTWTYRQLDKAGNRIANLLLSLGAQTGDLIATCFDKCAEASFAILGVLKAGCAYVAIDPGAPFDRKSFILGDAGCKFLLTTKATAATLETKNGVQYLIVDDKKTLEGVPEQKPSLKRKPTPQNTCYCLYTSGTTGTPKGCLISHDSAIQAMMSFSRIFEGHWTSDSRWLQFASFHFDVSVLEQYWSWSVGICMTTAPRDLILEDLPTFLRQAQITHLDLTPSLARLITPQDVPSLCEGVFIVGGEQVSHDIINTWGDAGCLYNFYGPSEVTIGCTVHPRVQRGIKPTNIGQLWANVGGMVLQPGTETPVMRGAVGELCLSGVLVGKGYLNRPQLTDEKFAILPDEKRIYRTGDLVRMLHDDSFEFMGRIDDQVKLRGQRLEIGEINQVIKNADEQITNVATMVLKHPTQGREQLIAFFTTLKTRQTADGVHIVFNKESSELADRIRRHCMDKMPGYMVPSSVCLLSSLPLSANNKVDTKVLKKLYEEVNLTGQQVDRDSIKLQPEDEVAFNHISSLLSEHFDIAPASVNPGTKLFELGIDSVSAIGFAHSLRSEGFQAASIQAVLRSPLVLDLVRRLKSPERDGSAIDLNAAKKDINNFATSNQTTILESLEIPSNGIENISPCTPLQEGMISKVVSSDAEDTTYFAQFDFELTPGTDIDKLRQAWRSVTELTSILRTHFVPTGDGWAQVVLTESSAPGSIDASLSESDKNFDSWVSQAKALSKVRPWKVVLERNENLSTMQLFLFHGIYDGIALDLLLEKVAKVYTQEHSKQPSRSNFYDVLPYGPVATHQGAEEFWRKALPNVRRLSFERASQHHREGSEGSPFTHHNHLLLKHLGKLCGQLDVTLPAIFHAAWLVCLEQHFHANPTLGLVVSGRAIPHPGAEYTIGPMFNTIPATIEGLKNATTVHDLIKACHSFTVDALPYQHTALRQIAKFLGFNANDGLFDCLFVFQRERTDAYEHGLWQAFPSTSTPDYPLNLEVEHKRDGSFAITLVAKNTCLINTECEELLAALLSLLGKLDRDEVPLLPEAFTSQAQRSPSAGKSSQEIAASEDDNVSVYIWTATTESVRSELSELARLDADNIGFNKPSVFEMGLDSIDVMKLATRLKSAGYKVPISSIMRAPTVAGIAAAIEKTQQIDEGASSAKSFFEDRQQRYGALIAGQGINRDDIEFVLPVSAMQEGLLLDFEKYYNIMPYELLPEMEVDVVLRAWRDVVASHAILRTRFIAVEEGAHRTVLLQAITRSARLEVEETQQGDMSSAVTKLKQEVSMRGFDMPIIKLIVADEGGKNVILLGMPHAAYDGWSLQLLHQKVAARYWRLMEEQPNGSRDDLLNYQEHMQAALSQASNDSTRRFWTETVDVARPTRLRPSSQDRQERPAQLLQHSSRVKAAAVQNFCQNQAVTLQSLGLAAWSHLIARYTGSLDVCFGLVLSGRTSEGSDTLMFPTFNTVVICSHLDPATTVSQLVKSLHDIALDVSGHQHFPLKEILKLARARHGHSELFNTLFTFQKAPGRDSDVSNIYQELSVSGESVNPPYAVNIELEVNADRLTWTLASQKGMYGWAAANNILRELDQTMNMLITAPEKPVFSEGEQRAFDEAKRSSIRSLSPKDTTDAQQYAPVTITSTEGIVRDVLAEVSKTDSSKINKTTNLFNLGLDSISAIKLASTLKKHGLKIPVSKIIETQTVEGIAAAADTLVSQSEASTEDRPESAPTLGRYSPHEDLLAKHGLVEDDVEEILPATAGQRYMLEAWRASNGKLFYASFWLEVCVSPEALKAALSKLVDICPLLRTTFGDDGREMIQFQLSPATVRSGKVKPPWNYEWRQRGDDSNGLFVTLSIHHALYDAVSIAILLEQLNQLCSGLVPAVQHNDYDSFISTTHCLSPRAKTRQRNFWTSYLRPAQGSILDCSANARSVDADVPHIERFIPQLHAIADLEPRLRTEGVSIQALFFAMVGQVYASTLCAAAAATTSADQAHDYDYVVLGIYLSNRGLDIPYLPTLAAPTVNIVSLRVAIADGVGIWDAAKEVQRDLAEISRAEHCGVGLREVWEWTGVRVGCVVNWLSLPGGEDAETGKEDRLVWHASEEVRAEMAAGQGSEPVVTITGERGPGQEQEKEQERSPFLDDGGRKPDPQSIEWVVPTVDVEAKVEDGYLAMGLFSHEDLLGGEEGGRAWFEDVRGRLTRAEGKGKGRA